MLNVTVKSRSETVILDCLGRIVRGDETRLLCAAVRQHAPNIVLDLSEVEAIDAAGIGALISLQAAGIYLKLMNPTPQVRELLKVTRVDSVFEICEPISSHGTVDGSAEPIRGSATAPAWAGASVE